MTSVHYDINAAQEKEGDKYKLHEKKEKNNDKKY